MGHMTRVRLLNWIGGGITAVWLGGVCFYFRLADVERLAPNEIGDLLAGISAPLAFLWLVVGYLQQGIELRQNTEILKLQQEDIRASVEQAKRQADSVSQNELHARRDVFIQMSAEIYRELGEVLIDFIEDKSLIHDRAMFNATRDRFRSGQRHEMAEYFALLVTRRIAPRGGEERLAAALQEERFVALREKYCSLFEVILDLAAGLDSNNAILQMHSDSKSAELYRQFCEMGGRPSRIRRE